MFANPDVSTPVAPRGAVRDLSIWGLRMRVRRAIDNLTLRREEWI